ncbi:MAG: dihydropteroate synthase [Chitinophagales bacterium]|nr:dihydropteroate synthase [Chitinophagales bacterium]
MGILNITPDSFFDGGRHNSINNAVEHTAKMLAEGADIIDIGGASTRPNAQKVSEQEEADRVLPIIEKMVSTFPDIVISIDTYYSKVAEQAIESGASIVNDISGGTMDKKMFDFVAKNKLPYVLSHIQGTPTNMQENPQYNNVVLDVLKELSFKVKELEEKGANDIIVDLGFGFGKTVEHNYELLANLRLFKEALQKPLLVGVSRKSMLYKPLGITPQESLPATTAAHAIAIQNGADILRVHDVKATKQVMEVLKLVG